MHYVCTAKSLQLFICISLIEPLGIFLQIMASITLYYSIAFQRYSVNKRSCKNNQVTIVCQFKTSHLNMCTFSESITPGQTSLDRIQRDQCNDSRNYVETQLLLVQELRFQRFVVGQNIGSNTMLTFMNHICTRQSERYQKISMQWNYHINVN